VQHKMVGGHSAYFEDRKTGNLVEVDEETAKEDFRDNPEFTELTWVLKDEEGNLHKPSKILENGEVEA